MNFEQRVSFMNKIIQLLELYHLEIEDDNLQFAHKGYICIKCDSKIEALKDKVIVEIDDTGEGTYSVKSDFVEALNKDSISIDEINKLIEETIEEEERKGKREEAATEK